MRANYLLRVRPVRAESVLLMLHHHLLSLKFFFSAATASPSRLVCSKSQMSSLLGQTGQFVAEQQHWHTEQTALFQQNALGMRHLRKRRLVFININLSIV